MSDPGNGGHQEVRTWKEYIMDFGDVTDDGEVQLNLPREEDKEWNLPAEDARDLLGETRIDADRCGVRRGGCLARGPCSFSNGC